MGSRNEDTSLYKIPYQVPKVYTQGFYVLHIISPEVSYFKAHAESTVSKVQGHSPKSPGSNTQKPRVPYSKAQGPSLIEKSRVPYPKGPRVPYPKGPRVQYPKGPRVQYPKGPRVQYPKGPRVPYPKAQGPILKSPGSHSPTN